MLRYMLDTSICIYVIRERDPALLDVFNQRAWQICMSSITLAELHYGVEKSSQPERNRTVLDRFAAGMPVLPFANEAAMAYGEIKAHLFRAGTPCGPNDMLIGAHARSEGLTLVTNNRREFDRMPGLRVENWV